MSTNTGWQLFLEAQKKMPPGSNLFSKLPTIAAPIVWPSYASEAKGAEVWDIEGKHYYDFSHNGVGAHVLGVGDPEVDDAVIRAIKRGTSSSLLWREELDLIDRLIRLHPWAKAGRLARGGGESAAMAVRIARAATGRDKLLVCSYSGWHDWYLALNLNDAHALDELLLPNLYPAGVPDELAGTVMPFRYNDLAALDSMAYGYPGQVAAIIIEPVRSVEPAPGFLEGIRALATKIGAVLIIDEVSAGFRLTTGGAHLCYGLEPDMAIFAKAMGNGYPIAAVIGKEWVMEACEWTFISTTFATERIGPVAALATINKFERENVASHLNLIGSQVKLAWYWAAGQYDLKIKLSGINPLAHLTFDYPNGQAIRTLFTQLMLDKGFLATDSFYATYAHTEEMVGEYGEALSDVFPVLAQAIEQGKVEEMLVGGVAIKSFGRLTG